MIFNPDLFNEAQEVIFSRKTGKFSHPKITSNNIPVPCTHYWNCLDMHLNEISNFNKPTHKKIAKANKKNCITRRLLNILPINTLFTIYKSFVNPYIYY